MNLNAPQITIRRNRLFAALAACGLAATGGLAPASATAAGPVFRATAYEWRAPMDRPGSGGISAIEAGDVSTASPGSKAGGPGTVPSALTPFFNTPTALSFSVPLGQTSLPQRSVLTNQSGYACSSISLNFSNAGAAGFTYVSDCGALADGSSCNIDVSYRPVNLEPFVDSTMINVFGAGCFASSFISLTGKGTRSPSPLVQVSPASLNFPPTAVADFSDVQFLTVRNDSSASMDIGGTGSGDFLVLPPFTGGFLIDSLNAPLAKGRKAEPPPFAGNCYGFVSPGQTCDLGVVFGPTGTGVRNGIISISASTAANTRSVSVTGIGRAAGVLGVLSVTEEIDFGPVSVGATSAPREFGIRNNTGSPVTISELTVTGDFEVQKGTCDTIAAAESCTANLLFKPVGLGPRSGNVTVRTPSDSSPYVTPLKGSGILNTNPMLMLSARQLGYSQGIVGSGESLSLNATNTGAVDVNIARIYALGDYMATHTCPAFLGPGLSCTIEVGFVPRLVGLRTGSLVVESNAIQSPNTVELKGTGCTFFAASARGRTLLCSPN